MSKCEIYTYKFEIYTSKCEIYTSKAETSASTKNLLRTDTRRVVSSPRNRESLLDDLGVALMPPLSPGEDLATAAGATSPPLTWQDVDHRRGCGGNASINAGAVVDNDYKDNGGDGDDIDDGDSGRDLVLALTIMLAQPNRSWTRYTREEFVIAMMPRR